MIEISYQHDGDTLNKITDKLLENNIGFKTKQDPEIKGIAIRENEQYYYGEGAVTDFVNKFIEDVAGWGRCACEDKDY